MSRRQMLNEALKLVRLYWQKTQTELAAELQVSQSLISDVEAGRKAVSLDLLERYSAALGIKMSQLMFFAEELEGQPVQRRGKLIIAEGVLALLQRLQPDEPARA